MVFLERPVSELQDYLMGTRADAWSSATHMDSAACSKGPISSSWLGGRTYPLKQLQLAR